MKNIYSYGLELTQRNLTLPDIRANKVAGLKMTQATAKNAEEAAAVQAAGIDMVGLAANRVEELRASAPNIYMIAALNPEYLITPDEVLREAFDCMMKGADQLYTIRSHDIVTMLAKEGFSVHGHVGLVPRLSVMTGGLRAMGKTADEVLSIMDDIRRLEDAGAVAVEVECVASEAMDHISRNTSLTTHAIGSGAAADVIFLFTEDICGENPNPPRHAHAFGDLLPLHKAVNAERLHALSAFQKSVTDGAFPDATVSVGMAKGEHDKLTEALARKPAKQ